MLPAELPERFVKKTQQAPSGCVLWTAALSTGGYGSFTWEGRPVQAHRFAFAVLRDRGLLLRPGRGGDRTVIDHMCGVTACCNVEHLRPLNHRANIVAAQISREPDRPVGVSQESASVWRAAVKTNGVVLSVGRCESMSDAAVASDAARWLLDGSTPNADRALCPYPNVSAIEAAKDALLAAGIVVRADVADTGVQQRWCSLAC
jgi:hypothetical protein